MSGFSESKCSPKIFRKTLALIRWEATESLAWTTPIRRWQWKLPLWTSRPLSLGRVESWSISREYCWAVLEGIAAFFSSLGSWIWMSLTSIVAEVVLEQAELRDIVQDGLRSVRSMRDFSSLFHSAILVKADALFYVVDVYDVFSASKSGECSMV